MAASRRAAARIRTNAANPNEPGISTPSEYAATT
jgi:hypothetical protein